MDILICGSPRSGNTLVANIIGSHSNAAVPSGNIFFWTLVYYKFGNQLFDKNNFQLIETIESKIGEAYLNFNKNQMKELAECMANGSEVNVKRLIDCSLSIYKSSKRKFIAGVKDPGAERYTKEILNMYPKCKIVHVVRDPFSVIASKKTSLGGDIASNIDPIYLTQLKECMLLSIHNKSVYPNNYHVVKYEDIVKDPSETINQMCIFLNLEYQEEMLQMSGNKDWNELWKGTNSSFDKDSFRGISKVALDRKEYLSDFEKYYIANKFSALMKLYDYEFPIKYKVFKVIYLKPLAVLFLIQLIRISFKPIRSLSSFLGLDSFVRKTWSYFKKITSVV
ncbi:sulfotransferase [Candidatus Pseudothioglobus singularis]|nr:sulfotransferase [Candidatus Pseudothioglobus singularis]